MVNVFQKLSDENEQLEKEKREHLNELYRELIVIARRSDDPNPHDAGNLMAILSELEMPLEEFQRFCEQLSRLDHFCELHNQKDKCEADRLKASHDFRELKKRQREEFGEKQHALHVAVSESSQARSAHNSAWKIAREFPQFFNGSVETSGLPELLSE